MPHHSTVKKAAERGILLEDAPEGSDYRFRAFWPERGVELWGSNATDLCNNAILAKMYTIEHGLRFEQEDGTIQVTFNGHELADIDADASGPEFYDAATDALEAVTDEMREGAPAEEDDEEEARGGSVVPVKYKNAYKEAGHPGHCGDWLASTLNQYCLTHDGAAKREVTNVEAVDAIAEMNGVDTAKWNRTTAGWQGRLRMSMRNALVGKIVAKGVLLIPGGVGGAEDDMELAAPEEWVRANSRKVAAAKEPGNKKKKAA